MDHIADALLKATHEVDLNVLQVITDNTPVCKGEVALWREYIQSCSQKYLCNQGHREK